MSKSVVAAFSMSDLEQLKGYSGMANFARKKGSKDKQKRKGKGLKTAGALAGAGVLGAAGRYGGAAAKTALAQRGMYNNTKVGGRNQQAVVKNTANRLASAKSGGARGALSRDLAAIKNAPGNLKRGIELGAQRGATGAALLGKGKSAQRVAGAIGAAKGALGTGGGKLGAALLGAAAVGGAGAAALRMRKKRK